MQKGGGVSRRVNTADARSELAEAVCEGWCVSYVRRDDPTLAP